MNNKRIKKVKKSLRKMFSNWIIETQKMSFYDRLLLCKDILCKIKPQLSNNNIKDI